MMFLFTHSQERRLQPAHLKTFSYHIHSGESLMKLRYELCAWWWGCERDNVTNPIFHTPRRWNWWSFSKPDLELNSAHSFLPTTMNFSSTNTDLYFFICPRLFFSLKQICDGKKNNCSVVETGERWWNNEIVSKEALVGGVFLPW